MEFSRASVPVRSGVVSSRSLSRIRGTVMVLRSIVNEWTALLCAALLARHEALRLCDGEILSAVGIGRREDGLG